MSRSEIKIAGFGGQGVIMAGMIIGKAASIFGSLHATMIQSFGPEARGSACSAQVIVDRDEIAYPYVRNSSILVALNQEAYKQSEALISDGGTLIYEEDMVKPGDLAQRGIRMYSVPATRIAEELGRVIVGNVVMVGFFTAVTNLLDYQSVEQAVRDSVPKAAEELNLKALRRGFEHGTRVLAESKSPSMAV
ncbi:MAG: 2-oxoacid:acceptor oxidoreductase family protein [Candidatus Zixiibacteriota bacterium]